VSRLRVRGPLLAAFAAVAAVAPSCGQNNGGHGGAGAAGTQAGADSGADSASDAQAEDVSAADSASDATDGSAGDSADANDAGPCGDVSERCCREDTCHSGLICIGSPSTCQVEMGQACTQDSDCADGICAPIGPGGAGICTTSCTTTAHCVPGWTCGPAPGETSNVCQCTPKNEVCDGKDDDCNGIVDDPAPAEQVCAAANGANYYCANGVCTCNLMCGGACLDGEDPQNCGGCGHVCPAADPTCQGGQCSPCPTLCASDELCAGKSCGSHWAGWPMPNPASAGLPNPASYDTTLVPGAVIDNVTGLMWQRAVDPNTYGFFGSALGETYCANLSLGGYNDWRLPTEIELYSLVDYTTQNPAIDATAFPGLGLKADAEPGDYWFDYFMTTDYDWPLPHGGWLMVDFDYGSFSGGMTYSWIRCVRGPAKSATSLQHYAIGTGVVTDNFTHLTWQRSVDSNEYTWASAKDYCASLALAGGGWRVPSVKELATLVDVGVPQPGFSQAEPAIDSAAFPDTPAAEFWSSSASDSGKTWMVDFLVSQNSWGSGILVYTDAKTDPERVRCVR
jgi:Protein of unknown function (DUF1566)